MKLPKVRFYNYKSQYHCWALVASFTVSNITFQVGPLYLYIGWSPVDYAWY